MKTDSNTILMIISELVRLNGLPKNISFYPADNSDMAEAVLSEGDELQMAIALGFALPIIAKNKMAILPGLGCWWVMVPFQNTRNEEFECFNSAVISALRRIEK